MKLLLGIDLGTSYFKVGLFDATGRLRGLGRVPVSVERPAPGRCELPVSTFWALLRRGLREALAEAGASPAAIAALSYSSQANTFLLLDAVGGPLTPLVLWTDDRAERTADELAPFANSATFAERTGLAGISGRWAPAKWLWFQQHEPAIWARAARVMTISDYFTHALTGERVGDAGTAALLGALDPRVAGWWDEALGRFGVTRSQLSDPLRPSTSGLRTGQAAARLLDLPVRIPFAVGGLDHQMAAVGAGVGGQAEASLSTGTVLAATALTTTPDWRPGCLLCPDVQPGRFVRLTFDPDGAGQLERFQRSHYPGRDLGELISQAVNDAAVRSPELGELRALLEDIADRQAGLLRRIAEKRLPRTVSATGGGARNADWLRLTARRLGVRLLASACPESACAGAAIFASVAAGIHSDVAAATHAMVATVDVEAGMG